MPASKKRQSRSSGASSIADFKKKSGGLVELPSGLTVKLKNKGGMRAFLASGMIPNSLMTIIQSAINSGTSPDFTGIFKSDGSMDEDMIQDMLLLTDRVVVDTLVEPPVFPAPTDEDVKQWNLTHKAKTAQVSDPEDLRDEDLLYVDEIDEEDKMFIFQWVTGGTQNVEQFRKELATTMDDLAGQQDVPSKAKSPGGSRRR